MGEQLSYSSLFCVLNNPARAITYVHEADGTLKLDDRGNKIELKSEPTPFTDMSPQAMCEYIVKTFCDVNESRSAWAAYCISADGLHHIHCVFEGFGDYKFRFSAVKKVCGEKVHIESTKGNKAQVEDYILKQGKFEEKGEIVVSQYRHGEIKGAQGQRTDLLKAEEYIESGLTPKEIFEKSIIFRKQEKVIRDAYYAKRVNETPYIRPVKVFWLYGETGSGKSYFSAQLHDACGRENMYVYSDFQNGGLDNYYGEKVLFIDEYRSAIKYSNFLRILDVYLSQYHARQTNVWGLWNYVIITSPYTPDEVYTDMLECSDTSKDSIEQLLRRLTAVVHFSKDESGNYIRYGVKGESLYPENLAGLSERKAIELLEKTG